MSLWKHGNASIQTRYSQSFPPMKQSHTCSSRQTHNNNNMTASDHKQANPTAKIFTHQIDRTDALTFWAEDTSLLRNQTDLTPSFPPADWQNVVFLSYISRQILDESPPRLPQPCDESRPLLIGCIITKITKYSPPSVHTRNNNR